MSVNDTRVVEMQFQNKQFEKNISTSQKSLERFKKELNFDDTSKGLHNFSKSLDAVDFTKLTTNIQKLTDKFTGFGNVGEFIISRLRQQLEGLADKAIAFSKSLTFGQLDEGKEKFEKMNMSIRTIMAATGKTEEEVAEVMERLNTYTDQTSYNFADMAQNIGKFTSVGIPLEQAEKQMEGIANWAARSGAGINEASRAMYNLSQAMGVGSLKLLDWKSIENAGMATKEFKEQLIAAGVAAGTLEMSVQKDANGMERIVYKTSKKLGKQVEVNFQNLSQTLNKGWADTTVIGNTLMGYYYDDLMYQNTNKMTELTEEQKTMFNNLVKETGKIDQKSWKEIEKSDLGGDEIKRKLLEVAEAHGTLTAEVGKDGEKIYTTLDNTGKKIEFTFNEFEKGLSGSWLTKNIANAVYGFDDLAMASYQAAQKCTTFSDVLNAWKDMISTGWMATMQHIFGGLSESINLFSAMCDKVSENILGIFGKGGTIESTFARWETIGGRDSLWALIIGEAETPEGEALYEGAYGLLDIIGDIKEMISDAFWDVMKTFAEGYYDSTEMAEWDGEDSMEFRLQFLAFRIRDFTDSVQDFIRKVKEFFSEIPEGMSKSRWEMVKDTVQAVFHAISLAVQTVSGLFHFFGRIRKQLGPSINAITSLFSTLVGSFIRTETGLRKTGGIRSFFIKLADLLVPVTNIINRVVIGVTDMLSKFVSWGKESGFFTKVWNTIKSIFYGISNLIDKISGPVFDLFKGFGDAFQELFTNGISKETIKKAGKSILNAFRQLFDGLKGYIPELFDKVRGLFSGLFDKVEDALEGQSSGILSVVRNILKGIFGRIGDMLHNLVNGFGDGSMMDVFKAVLGGGIGLIADVIRGLRDLVKGVNLYDLIMGVLGGMALFSLIGVLRKAKKMFSSFGEIAESISGIFDGIREKLGGKEHTFDEKFINIAKGITMIALAIVVLGKMRWQDALQGGLAVIAILGTMALFIWGLGKIVRRIKAADIGKIVVSVVSIGIGLLALSAGVYVMVRALKPLANLNWEQLGKMGAGLVSILGVFAAFSAITSKIKIRPVTIAGFALLAVGIGAMILALKPLTKLNWDQMGKMGVGLLGVLLMLAGFSHIMGSISNKGVAQVGLLALGIGVMVFALLPLANMNWNQLLTMGVSLAGILTILAGFSHIMGSISGKGLSSTIGLAIGIAILVTTLMPLSSMDWDGLLKMAAGFGGVLLLLAGFSHIMGTIKGKGIFGTIFLATGIVILMEAIKPLAFYNWEQMGRMGAGLAVVLLSLAAFSQMAGSIKVGSMFGLILLATSILILLEAVKPIASYDWDELAKMGVGMIAVLAILAAASKLTEKLSLKGVLSALLVMAGFAVLISAFGTTLILVEDIGADKMLAFAAGITLLALSISVIISAMGTIKTSQAAGMGKKIAILAIAVVAISALMLVFTKAVRKVDDIEAEKMVGFGLAILAISGAVALLATVFPILGNMGGGAILKGALALAAIGTALGAVIDILAGFAKSAIEKMSSALATMGTALRWFDEDMALVDSDRVRAGMELVKKLCESAIYVIGKGDLSDGLNNFAVAMSRLGIGLKRYWTNISGINVNSARIASEDFVMMSDNLNKLKTCENAADIIADLAGAIGIYCDTLNGKKIDDAPDAQKIKDTLIAISESVPENDIMKAVQEVAGDEGKVSLNKYAIGLENIATALHTFGEKSKDMDFSQISTAISKLQEISDLGPELETDFVKKFDIGGFIQFSTEIKGQKESLGTFSLDVEALGGALSDFGTKVGGITNWEQIDNGIQILDKFAGIQNKLPFVGGFITTITGAPDIQQFALKLPHVGDGLKGFCDKIQGASSLNNGEASTAAKVLEELGTASKSIGTNSGIFTFFASTDVEKFGGQLPGLGEGIAGFAGKIKGAVGPVTKDAVDNAVTVLTGICEAASKIPPNRGLKTLYEGIDYTEFARQMPPLATGVVGFAENLRNMPTDVDSDKIRAASDVLVDICTAANMIPANEGIKTWLENINYEGFADDMGNLGTGVTNFLRAVHRVGNGNDLTLDPEVTSSLIRSKELLGYMIDVYNIIFDETGNVKLSKLRLGDNAGWFNRFGFELGGIFTNFLEGIKQFNSDYSAEESLSEAASKYELIKPIIEQITSLVSEYSSLKLAKVENTEPGSIIEGIVAGLQSLLSFDSEIAWTDKHSEILDRVTSMFESLSSLQMMLVNYRSTMGTESGAAVFISMLLDLADGLGVFAEQVNSYGFDNPNSAEYWSDTVEAAFVRIKEMMASIGSLGFLKEIVELQAIPTVFGQIITAYKEFITSTNALLVGGTSYAWTEAQDNVLARVQQIVDVMSTIDDISTPNITPIVDFDSVRDQINRWASEGVPENLQIGANWMMTMKLDADQLTTITPHDYTTQINNMNDKIGLMQQKLDNVYDRMNQFRVYMDTGTMVGVLAPRIDAYQGRDGFMAGRGVTITRR